MDEFFSATLLGKFFVKTVWETAFVIFIFSTYYLHMLMRFLKSTLGVPQSVVRYLMAYVSLQRSMLEPSVEPLKFDALVWAWQGFQIGVAIVLLINLINAVANAHKLKKSN